jgi:hypothetical protein
VVHRCDPKTIFQNFNSTSNMHYDAILGILFLQQHHLSFD